MSAKVGSTEMEPTATHPPRSQILATHPPKRTESGAWIVRCLTHAGPIEIEFPDETLPRLPERGSGTPAKAPAGKRSGAEKPVTAVVRVENEDEARRAARRSEAAKVIVDVVRKNCASLSDGPVKFPHALRAAIDEALKLPKGFPRGIAGAIVKEEFCRQRGVDPGQFEECYRKELKARSQRRWREKREGGA